ncbi:amidophosphoribosyltransferase [Candidatus Woesearchaeota archaeon]|nr:amidophosphoribosyltransferase [Candidatus Woesearchaeota archaeon]
MRTIEEIIHDEELHSFSNDSCALAGAVNIPYAATVVRDMLQVQQHRGEKSVGIVSSKGDRFYAIREMGKVDEVFPIAQMKSIQAELPGSMAIGHTRYATRGLADYVSNIQPFIFNETKFGHFAFAHNGQLVDINKIHKTLLQRGAVFQSKSDSELLAHVIAKSDKKSFHSALKNDLAKIPCSYSALVETDLEIIGFRDPFGVRPLSIARKGNGYLIASETVAFRLFPDAEFIRHIEPGEIVVFNKKKIKAKEKPKSMQMNIPIEIKELADAKNQSEFHCIFEQIYFQDPRSEANGFMHEDFRQRCGRQVYLENKEFFDEMRVRHGSNLVVVPILDSGKQGAIGFSRESGILYKEYFMRRHNAPHSSGRSYTAHNQRLRILIAGMKLDLRKEKVLGKTVITVDDSNVRGTTARTNNERLRDAGAREIYNVYLSPTIENVCYLGMDHQNLKELIAYRKKSLEGIAKEIFADRIFHISLAGLNSIVNDTYKMGICTGCFGGKYPVDL